MKEIEIQISSHLVLAFKIYWYTETVFSSLVFVLSMTSSFQSHRNPPGRNRWWLGIITAALAPVTPDVGLAILVENAYTLFLPRASRVVCTNETVHK